MSTMITRLKAKIEKASVTGTNLEYEGSISIDTALMHSAGILPYEQVQVLNLTTGGRYVTYAIECAWRKLIINGALARKFQIGDRVTILAYELTDCPFLPYEPRIVKG